MVVMLALWLLAACKPRIPSQVIQPDDMEDVLYDYYLASGMSLGRPLQDLRTCAAPFGR